MRAKALAAARWIAQAICISLVSSVSSGLYAATAHTNGEGLAFWIEFDRTEFVAGSELPATMGASNTLGMPHPFRWMKGRYFGTEIGDFVVRKQTTDKPLDSSVSPEEINNILGEKGLHLRSYETTLSEGFVHRGFALTNPGTYLVSARGTFRSTNGPQHTFELQTPPVAIQILPPTNTPAKTTEPSTGLEQPTAPPVPAVNPSPSLNSSRVRPPVSPAKNSNAVPDAIAAEESKPSRTLGLLLCAGVIAVALIWWRVRQKSSR